MKKDKELKPRADGRYCRKVTLPSGESKFVYGYTPAEVKRKKDKLMLLYALGATNINSKVTVQKWGKMWWEVKKEGKTGHKSQYGYTSAMNNYIFPFMGNMKVIDVRDMHIQTLINEMGKKDLSESLQKKVLIALNGMFKYAKKNGLIISNPVEDVEVYNVPVDIREALTPNEVKIALDTCKGMRAEIGIHLALYCGLRRGELAEIKWEDINNQYECLIVTNAVEYINNRPKKKGPKSEAGIRIIPIPPELWQMLQNSPRNSIYIVPSAKGVQMSESAVRRLIEPVQNRIEKRSDGFRVTWHRLRHTYSTNLEKMGLSPKTRQYLMGHATVSLTDNVYTHFQDEHLELAAKKLKGIYKTSLKSTPWNIQK